jgi:small subunit ribosomal protein S16
MTGVSHSKTINQNMPVKIRLQRQGKKGKPYFHIVVADSRSPRDGKYIERLGMYNPNTNPATIEIDVDGAVNWLGKGAQPTDTARAILSYKGVLYKNHLLKGVKKGALTEEQAHTKFDAWMAEKLEKIEAKKKGLVDASTKEAADRLKAEAEVNKAREASLAAAAAAHLAEEAPADAAEATDTPVAAEVSEGEAVVEEPAPVAQPDQEEAEANVAQEAVAEAAENDAPATEAPAEEIVADAAEPAVETEPKVEAPAEEDASTEAEEKEEPKAEANAEGEGEDSKEEEKDKA